MARACQQRKGLCTNSEAIWRTFIQKCQGELEWGVGHKGSNSSEEMAGRDATVQLPSGQVVKPLCTVLTISSAQ